MLMIATVFLAAGSLDNIYNTTMILELKNNTIPKFIVDNGCGCPCEKHSMGHIPLPDWVERTRLPEPTEPLLADLDWRNNGGDYTTPAKNQGNCGSCWAHSAIGAFESAVEIANSNPGMNLDLSEQYVLSCTGPQGICPNDCVSGGNAYWAFWYMKDGAPQNGAIPETCFSYRGIDANGCDFYSCSYPPVLCSAKCANWQTLLVQTISNYGYSDTSVGLTPAQIKAQLANGPVCLAMYVYADFNPGPGYSPSFDANGIYRWDRSSPYIGGHAVLCVGYQDSLGCWICKNSWGAAWGNMNGFFKIAYGECQIEREMSWMAFTPTSNNAPSVSITSPTPGATVSGTINILGTASDSDGTVVSVEVRIDSGSWWTASGTTSWSNSWDTTTVSDGGHTISARSKDNNGAYSTVASTPVIVNNAGNHPPNTPSNPSGPTTGVTGVQYQYTTSTTDPDTDQIKYGWDFDNDGIVKPEHWTGYYASGAPCIVNIIFGSAGTYYLRVIANDIHGALSSFSSALTVVISTGTNIPPTVLISSPTSGATISSTITIQGSASDSDGTVTQVEVRIDSGSWWTASGTISWSTNWDTTTVSDGSHTIYAQSKDNNGAYSTLSSVPITVRNVGNRPPNKPNTPSGETHGRAGTIYQYNSSAVDPDGDQVSLLWDWGDGTDSGWQTPVNSGDIVTASHSWSKADYEIKVKAKDTKSAESDWSDPLPITMPYHFNPLQQFLELLFQRFPTAFPLLRHLMGY